MGQQERQDQYSAISDLRCRAEKDHNKQIDSCKTFCLPVNTGRQRESPTACQGSDLVNMVILFHSEVGGGGGYSQSMVCWPEKQYRTTNTILTSRIELISWLHQLDQN